MSRHCRRPAKGSPGFELGRTGCAPPGPSHAPCPAPGVWGGTSAGCLACRCQRLPPPAAGNALRDAPPPPVRIQHACRPRGVPKAVCLHNAGACTVLAGSAAGPQCERNSRWRQAACSSSRHWRRLIRAGQRPMLVCSSSGWLQLRPPGKRRLLRPLVPKAAPVAAGPAAAPPSAGHGSNQPAAEAPRASPAAGASQLHCTCGWG